MKIISSVDNNPYYRPNSRTAIEVMAGDRHLLSGNPESEYAHDTVLDMAGTRTSLGLSKPEALQPDSTVETTIGYTNDTADMDHQLDTLSLARTCNPGDEQAHQLDASAPAGTTQYLLKISLAIPKCLGDHHGLNTDQRGTTQRPTETDFSSRAHLQPRLDIGVGA